MHAIDPVGTMFFLAPIAVAAGALVVRSLFRLREIHDAEVRRKREIKWGN